MSQQDYRLPVILQFFLWIIPINIYVIGDWMGSGIHWLFFRYQITNIGNSFIMLHRETSFVLSKIITGKSAVSIILWDIGFCLIIIATLLMLFTLINYNEQSVKWAAICNTIGALVFTVSMIIIYGITFNGPSGFGIPFGIPVILFVAYFQYRGTFNVSLSEQNFDAKK